MNVTDYAMLRYFERVDRVDIAQVRARMVAAGVPPTLANRDSAVVKWMAANGYAVDAIKLSFEIPQLANAIRCGAKNLRHPDGYWFVIKGPSVVSIILDDMALRHRTQAAPKPKGKPPYYPRRKRNRNR